MQKKLKILAPVLLLAVVVMVGRWYLHGRTVAVLDPQGPVAYKERQLIIVTVLLALIVVLPVFTMLFAISWKYREGNKKAIYTPNWDHSRVAETVWWGVPTLLILIISIITWNSSHQLDPFKSLASTTQPITIQVVALDWKWLFIYPEQNIASVNYVRFPKSTPVNFEITSDATMNSFWVPRLGGQIYAMTGMSTQLHLMADQTGKYNGSSANISGAGFAGMKFTAEATSESDFQEWVQNVQLSSQQLDQQSYNKLARPSQNNPSAYYALGDPALYTTIIDKYMGPDLQMLGMHGAELQ